MKALWLAGALALGLATSVVADPVHGIPPPNGGVHGIIIHRCHPARWNNWCRHHCVPSRWNNWCRPRGIIIGHPIGVRPPVHPIGVVPRGTQPGHGGLVNGIQPEQRVQH
jgi:hypothetical protein